MKVVSLFSGAGGLDLGFKMAGHDIIWANDMYADAVETYKKNIGDHIICEDISKIKAEDIPDCDIIIGGFPCQGFSVANTKRHEDDERNVLYKQLIRMIDAKRPKFFLAENVKGYIYPLPTNSKNGKDGLPEWISVSEAMAHIPDPDLPNDLPNHVYSKYKLNFNGYLGHRPLDPDKPAPTVTARGDNKGGVVILPHPNGKRRMSCRELATVQSFPLNYEFCGNNSSVYRQIGNAVPPLLGRAVADVFNQYKGEKKNV